MSSDLRISVARAAIGISTGRDPSREDPERRTWVLSVLLRLYFEIPPGKSAFIPEHRTALSLIEPFSGGPVALHIRRNRWPNDGEGVVHRPDDGIYVRTSGTMLTGGVFKVLVSEFPGLADADRVRMALTCDVANSAEPIRIDLMESGPRRSRDYGNDTHDPNADFYWDLACS